MRDEAGQPEPARPVVAPQLWQRPASQLTDADWDRLLTARERAKAKTPGLQKALTGVCILAILLSLVAGGVFSLSHFRLMDIEHGVDAEGNSIGWDADYTAFGLVFFAVCGALLALAGIWLNVGARTRRLLMWIGASILALIGIGTAVLANPWNDDLRSHYHVGEWGSAASFDGLFYTLDALALLLAGCGVAIVAVSVVQRRRIAVAYQGRGGVG